MRPLWLRRLKRSLDRFALYTVDVVYERRTGRGALFLGGILRAASWLFDAAVQTRNFLYRNRILRDQPLGCLVVVVGNLTVGGTGKTPVVEKLARALADRGRKVAILSRGYKSKPERFYKRWWRWLTHGEPPPPKVVSDGRRLRLDSEQAGDEPYMLARNLLPNGVVVLVDKNRVKAGHYAIRHFGADTLILDDGFQYLPLRGQLNLLLVDQTNPFGNHQLLPRGILREPVKHLSRASYIFLTKSDGTPRPDIEKIVRQYKPNAEFIVCAHRPKYLTPLGHDGPRLALSELRGKHVGLFSGIAAPENFEKLIREAGAEITVNRRFLDHHRFTEDEIEAFFEEAVKAKVDFVVTTEKDAVRLSDDFKAPIALYYLRMEVEILKGADDFDEAVSRICFPKIPEDAIREVSGKQN